MRENAWAKGALPRRPAARRSWWARLLRR